MKNADIIKSVADYIETVAKSRNLTHRDIAELCSKKGANVAQTTISKMFSKPSSTTISTLLKVCDGLDLNLSTIFHAMENMKTAGKNSENRFRNDIKEDAFLLYSGNYHIFFLSTTPNTDVKLVHGILKLGDLHSSGECTASLRINTGDLNDKGEPAYKFFEGRLTYSTTGIMFCSLACARYGDMWHLTFPHVKLNIKALSCTMGCATTSCSGPIAYPAIHRFCFCSASEYPKISPETKKEIMGILRMCNETLFIRKDILENYIKSKNNANKLINHIEHYLDIADIYYAIPKETFKRDADAETFAHTMAELALLSDMETCMHILPEDSTQLLEILKRDKKGTVIKDASSHEINNQERIHL